MTSASRLLDPTDKASKKTAHSIHASREPKSDAKLQPSEIPTKSFRQKIYYLTHFNKIQVVIYRQTIKSQDLFLALSHSNSGNKRQSKNGLPLDPIIY